MFKSIQHSISRIVLSLCLTAVLLSGTNTTLSRVFAQAASGLGIVPAQSDPTDPFTRAWFIEKIQPGQSIERTVAVINNNSTETEVEIRSKDSSQTPDGSFAYIDNSETDKMVGSWIKLSESKVVIGPKQTKEVKFTITVPSGTQPGEYAGVIAVQPAVTKKSAGVSMVTRMGARVYITVPGTLKNGVKLNSFSFLTPQSENYAALAAINPSLNNENVFLMGNWEINSNVYTKVKGKITLTSPSRQFTQEVDQDFGPTSASVLTRNIPGAKWEKGIYKAKMEFTSQPVISKNKENITNLPVQQSIETEINITQEILDKFSTSKKPDAAANANTGGNSEAGFEIKETPAQPDPQNVQQANTQNNSNIVQPESVGVETKQDNSLVYVLTAVIFVLLGVVGIGGFIFLKKKKASETSKK